MQFLLVPFRSGFSFLFINEIKPSVEDFLGFFNYFSIYDILHCFIFRPSDSIVSEDVGIEPRTVATTVLAVRRANHARSHPQLG
jgi:hypothetical protein